MGVAGGPELLERAGCPSQFGARGKHYYWRTEYVADLRDELLATCREAFAGFSNPAAQLGILHLGGALDERDEADGAVGNRDVRYACGVLGMWEPSEPQAGPFRRSVDEAWKPPATVRDRRELRQLPARHGRRRPHRGRLRKNYERLRHAKSMYDPENVFRVNRNIAPA